MLSIGLLQQLEEWKKRRNAVILVHSYQPPEIQDIADVLGDSLDLSRRAAASKAEVLVFCGVHFMAETASILCPEKTVLLPEPSSGCPMADMMSARDLRELKAKHPGVPAVTYINSSADVKAESDICCTSANAEAVCRSLESEELIFSPDRNLGRNVAGLTGKRIITFDGYCPVHEAIKPTEISRARADHPGAEVLVHPECPPETVAVADRALSTSGMCDYARASAAGAFIIVTETGILHRLRKENPGKKFYPVSESAFCPDMKRITPGKVLRSLERLEGEVRVDAAVRERARRAIERMLAVG